MLGNFACFLSSADFLSKNHFLTKSFRIAIRSSNRLDSDQDRLFVGPDLSPNCLQRRSTGDKSPLAGKELIDSLPTSVVC